MFTFNYFYNVVKFSELKYYTRKKEHEKFHTTVNVQWN